MENRGRKNRLVKRNITLRRAKSEDAEMIFGWRNHPEIIVRGSSGKSVTWDEHENWFSQSLRTIHRILLIIEKDETAIGQIRFDRESEDYAIMSIYLLPPFAGKGLGVEAIQSGSLMALAEWTVSKIIACVLESNIPAQRAFLAAGFKPESSLNCCPARHLSFAFARNSS